jgi:hypothetical protein
MPEDKTIHLSLPRGAWRHGRGHYQKAVKSEKPAADATKRSMTPWTRTLPKDGEVWEAGRGRHHADGKSSPSVPGGRASLQLPLPNPHLSPPPEKGIRERDVAHTETLRGNRGVRGSRGLRKVGQGDGGSVGLLEKQRPALPAFPKCRTARQRTWRSWSVVPPPS